MLFFRPSKNLWSLFCHPLTQTYQVDYSLPLVLLSSMCPVNIKVSRHSFLIRRHKHFSCLFLTVWSSFLVLPIHNKRSSFLYRLIFYKFLRCFISLLHLSLKPFLSFLWHQLATDLKIFCPSFAILFINIVHYNKLILAKF